MIKFKKALKESDNRFDGYLDDLLGKEEEINEEVDSALLQNNQKLNYKTQKLLEKIQQDIDAVSSKDDVVVDEKVLQESKDSNPLFSNNEKFVNETNDMISALENLFKPKEVIEEVVISEDEIDVEETSYEDSNTNGNDLTPGEDSTRQDDSGEKTVDTDEV